MKNSLRNVDASSPVASPVGRPVSSPVPSEATRGSLRHLVRKLTGADLPRVIAVAGLTQDEVADGVAHARTSGSPLPIWAWCAETVGDTDIPSGCDRFISGANAAKVCGDLRAVWPALFIVAWTGRRGSFLKLLPFLTPPFRIVVANEAGDFFAARPGPLAEHLGRRLRDASASGARRIGDWILGAGTWLRAAAAWLYRTVVRAAGWFGNIIVLFWNALIALLGVLAKPTHPASRAAMRRFRHGCPAAALTVAPFGNRVVEILVPTRTWPRAKVVKAVRDSGAHFIVFRHPLEKASAEPLIALAREEGAFAVARQSGYAGWRKTVVAKHPFRRLQAGEISQVFAPWSTLIVIRRDLMERLGVPGAMTCGAALMLLYWKAAGSGLKSLVVGHEGEVEQEPAMELEDAELTLRVALSGRLRNMGPAEPHRLRGNLACSPPHRQPFRGLPRVLVVSPYLPFPLSHGGAVRMYNLCRSLSHEVDFVLACFREANETIRYDELHRVFREVYVVDANEKQPSPYVPKQVAEYRNRTMAELVRKLCLSRHVDIAQLEYTQMAEYQDHTGGVPVILVEHDITFTLYKQLAETQPGPEPKEQYLLWHAFERAALQCSNAVWTMSEHDKTIALEHGAPRRTTQVIPNGVDLLRFQPLRRQTQERAVLFVGSFRHLPNLLAFEALREIIMPLVWKSLPQVALRVIAGPNHERAADLARKRHLLAPDPRIHIQGFVEDVRPAYRECDVAAIPLPVSAGTNIKLMEAMACGRAVVSTPVGCQGLDLRDDFDLLIRDIGPGFAEALIALLRDEDARYRMAARARATAEMRFGWDAIATGALESYTSLMGRATETVAGD